jgi:trigger factor
LKGKKAITQYKIVADDKMIDEQIERISKQYGKLVSQDVVGDDNEIAGTFSNEAEEIENSTTIELDKIKTKKNTGLFIGKKVGDVVTVKTKGLFEEDYLLSSALGIDREKAEDLDVEVSFTISEINQREAAELNQELFDKLFGEGKVTSEEEMRAKIKEDAEGQFAQQAEQKLLNDVTEHLIDNTKFDLPAEFLTKWIQMTGETELTQEEATEEYSKSEKGLRYQLIEGKIIKDNDLQVQFDELKEFAKGFIKTQMAQFGQLDPAEEELDSIAARILSNQDEVKRLSEQLMSKKMLDFFKENANLKTKELSYEDFVKEVYG